MYTNCGTSKLNVAVLKELERKKKQDEITCNKKKTGSNKKILVKKTEGKTV